MNDPSSPPQRHGVSPSVFDDRSNAAALQHSDAAPAICRICRGEGTSAEPLFYPCKCSGSIKFVHQDCLMEWLSHSQKKYCELCKTSFRFTKLYAPDMPQSLPVHIFLEHMARYLVRNALLWLRAAVTISVWVCWLPYFMRVVWAFLFWVSDEGLGAGPFASRHSLVKPVVLGPAPTCAASPPYPLNTPNQSDSTTVVDKITFLNSTAGSFSATLLSDVGFLRNFTRSATVNRTVITVIEGQIITVLVIVCFILVILVRDYVVQQQPEINMRAAFADQENNNPPAPAQQPVDAEIRDDNGGGGGDDDDDDDNGEDNHDHDDSPESDGMGSDGETLDAGLEVHESLGSDTGHDINTGEPDLSSTDADMRNAIAPERLLPELAADSHESSAHDEAAAGSDNRASVIDYLRVYRQAGGNLEKILQIVEEENLEDKLGYWVDVAQRSIRERETNLADTSGPPISQEDVQSSLPLPRVLDFSKLNDRGQLVPLGDEQEATQKISKGKERERIPMSPDFSPHPANPDDENASGPSRPRARSDGPEPITLASALGNNSWTFDSLPTANQGDPECATPPLVPGPTDTTPVQSVNGIVRRRTPIPDSPPRSNHGDDVASIGHGGDVAHVVPGEPAVPIPEQRGFVARIANFMWGDLDQHRDIDQEQQEPAAAGDDDGAEDAWVDVPIAGPADANAEPNAGEVDAAAAAAMDAEAIEDLEDFEGVMELLGMRGPIVGLFQNAIFCAVLVSLTIFTCIFIPYNIGRFSVWIMANPILLVRMLMGLSKLIQDAAMMIGGFGSWCTLNIVDMFTSVIGGTMGAQIVSARKACWGLWTGAGTRVVEYALMEFPLTASEVQNFSAISHESLNVLKENIGWVLGQADISLKALARPDYTAVIDGRFVAAASTTLRSFISTLTDAASFLLDPSSWTIDLGEVATGASVNPSLAYWSGLDRFWAILIGYLTIFAVGALYLRRDSPFSRGAMMQAWEAGVIDTLHQASGIMKVILIISIEMLVFPLYCGLLLDGALLPLFEDATFNSRILFTYNYPSTSIFVHWFVGTGYMFHFALFVSMCRKIMRPGVLYFIRDPDDPEFHPVRDVLERNLTTQLRKILFSAFVYGALVIVCLGGVVWGLYYTMPGVLPVHYSSNEPVLEFPVDLLFYNFLMPLAVKFFKPGDGLHAMYTWWFRKCARGLRLTYFLFGERRIDEEGILHLSPELRGQVPPFKSLLLELDEHNAVIPKTWRDTFDGGDARPNPSISEGETRDMTHKKAHLVKTGQLKKSGRFVRAPASDRVKIPKGQRVFLTVSERNRRKDGNADDDMYASAQYQLVYVPPNFRARVFLFILFIWLFAAVTGVGFTIAPLVLGRTMFKMLIPAHIRTNDIYAFSIGIYVLGSLAYTIFRLGHLLARLRHLTSELVHEIARGDTRIRILHGLTRGAQLFYAYFFLYIVFPLLVSALMELYLSIPLHTYMNPPGQRQKETTAASPEGEAGRHTVRVIQSWTLGLLYLNLATRMITSLFRDTRAAMAVRSVMRRGYLKPDVDILTRAFVIPAVALSIVAIFGPPTAANLLINFGILSPSQVVGVVADTANLSSIFRYSYPVAAVSVVMVRYAVGLTRVFHRWTAGVRDEAYLIGERLHNFGAATAGSRKARKAWGAAGGGRL
ncbi:E3 ubiquitin-protein ligase MARCH6 [Metarhizium album ARSEF 1941]|uniref:RING-type E3 ubiquitin transferase n=1 Tax=Metarhizium album (strain ARSEF 1941) TaxID=1081103 RepID=A0A0B2WSU0_METAS|nr:E3 ubiquitin-protein ligase MARCH6 [Metarhizium album ARSEF 1941]KHN97103.1 E3 ubiquitin-protein ligase MARCH6 [Metarhizium album ARSEF 1941]